MTDSYHKPGEPFSPDDEGYAQFWDLRENLLRDIYQQQFQEMLLDDEAYQLNFSDRLGLDRTKIPILLPTTARTAVDTASAHIIVDWPRVHVPPMKVGAEQKITAQDRSERLIAFGQSLLYKASVVSGFGSPFQAAKLYMLTRGAAYIMVMPRFSILSDIASGRQNKPLNIRNWPFDIVEVDPLEIMVDPDGDPPRYFMRSRRMRWSEILLNEDIDEEAREYMSRVQDKKSGIDRTYTTIWEYWTEDTLQWFSEEAGCHVWTYDHEWGQHPLEYAYSGYGMRAGIPIYTGEKFTDSGAWKREQAAVGLLRHIRRGGMLYQEAITSSQAAKMINDAAFVDYLVPSTLAEDFEPGTSSTIEVELMEGQKIGDVMPSAIVGVPPNPALFDYIDRQTTLSFDATAPRAVQGLRDTGVDTAAQQSLQVSQARLRYDQPWRNMEHLMSRVVAKAAYFAGEVIKQPLNVYGGMPKAPHQVRVEPEDFAAMELVEVRLQTSQMDRDARIMMGERVIAMGGDPIEVMREYAGIDNPQEQLVAGIAFKLVNENPQVQQILGTTIQTLVTTRLQQKLEAAQAERSDGEEQVPMGTTPQQVTQAATIEGLRQTAMGIGTNGAAPGSPLAADMANRQQLAPPMDTGDDLPPMRPLQ